MNLRDFEYLAAVAELKHFGKAAERCNVSQPTLSMQLKKLEEYLGIKLFERNNKQVIVTKIGKEIVHQAHQILLSANEIKQLAKNSHAPLAGDFTLGSFPTISPYFLPIIVPKISEKLPNIRLLLVEEKTALLIEKLHSGVLDAALIALPVESENLLAMPLFDDPFMLAVYASHPLAKKGFVEFDDFAKEKLLLLEEGHCLRNQALDICSLIGTDEQQDFRATSLETLRQMVCSGVGITLIPRLAMRGNDGISYLPIKPVISRKIGLVWRKTSTRELLINAICEIIKNNS